MLVLTDFFSTVVNQRFNYMCITMKLQIMLLHIYHLGKGDIIGDDKKVLSTMTQQGTAMGRQDTCDRLQRGVTVLTDPGIGSKHQLKQTPARRHVGWRIW